MATQVVRFRLKVSGSRRSMGDKRFRLEHPRFGTIYVEIFVPGGSVEGVIQRTYITQWISLGDPLSYHFATGAGRLDSPYPAMDRSEVVKVIQSLALLP